MSWRSVPALPCPAVLLAPVLLPLALLASVLGAAEPPPGVAPGGRPAAASATPDTFRVILASARGPAAPVVSFPEPEDPGRPLMVLDADLEESIRSMAGRSPLWLEALRTIGRRRFPVLVGSVVQVEERLPALKRYRFNGAAAVWYFADRGGRAVAAAVMINLPKLAVRNMVTRGDEASLRRLVELHLAHEVYGHLLPVVESGDPAHPCARDPSEDDPPSAQMASCVMRRESRLLEDLGYEPRRSYLWNYWDEAIEGTGDEH